VSASPTRRFPDLRAAAVRGLLALYKCVVSPVVHSAAGVQSACRFQPTCSEYAAIAVAEYGAVRGGFMAFRRLLRCHPLDRGGFDPVPAKRSGSQAEYSGPAIS
jgi:putative membrane protein insertion efficiency factor